ncbi:T9SS type A sorting domain-containing protein, partial [Proteiniphilum sp. X52]|uniref:T9SS type A sorting domain-containing protein n=1 Tax=Proteiniphilum sp. X52 TaxID=2382159 RepID=UPI000F3D7D6A
KRIFIESNYELVEWEIFYSSGIKIHHETIDISINRDSYSSIHLPKGVYIVRVKTVDGTVSVKKVLVS